ncbi:hypothetical protein IW492_02560 [Enterococcus sp. BWB1-3]|nr:hypothetical protein [Enterococcus sp. BWB1-3]
MNQYDELLEKLASGELEELEVKNDNFFLFRDAWLRRGDRKQIIGEAAHGGHVIYRYEKES